MTTILQWTSSLVCWNVSLGCTNDEAITQMFRIHNEGKSICSTYSREEAEKKVADVRAFAAEHKHPLQCILEEAD